MVLQVDFLSYIKLNSSVLKHNFYFLKTKTFGGGGSSTRSNLSVSVGGNRSREVFQKEKAKPEGKNEGVYRELVSHRISRNFQKAIFCVFKSAQIVREYRKISIRNGAFSVMAPSLLNSLLVELALSAFKRMLKTRLFT